MGRDIRQVTGDTVEGTLKGGFWGCIAGVVCVAGAAFTGGASLAALPALLPAIGGGALVGTKLGAGVGGVVGALGMKDKIDATITQDLSEAIKKML
ncbi:MAG: hypothetical protein IJT20_01260 [Synergistaceae bacterium]|nr:hypothetical protein [Synergistaceae bacterium]